MNCVDCGTLLPTDQTIRGIDVDTRIHTCDCGSRYQSEQKIIRRLASACTYRGGANTYKAGVEQGSPQKETKQDQVSPDPDLNPGPSLLSVPRVEPKIVQEFETVGGKPWGLSDEDEQDIRRVCPGVDLAGEYAKVRLWLRANPTRRKTPRGMLKFISGWMERAQNRAGTAARPPDPRCAFHRAMGTLGKLPRTGEVAGCPECKHVSAGRSQRVSEPSPPKIGDFKLPTPEELAQLRRGAGGA